ncbi:hypothetical protein EMPG_12059 [Blastomyces silverae]|uniref:Uncharacterized protein n=1 Tax=Blastomyces silverae TaxID=2060906 RepID=A0A0H1BNP9_9EURO|nr:hypothetical protein EMPG_12059 [Blastomyces silverae]
MEPLWINLPLAGVDWIWEEDGDGKLNWRLTGRRDWLDFGMHANNRVIDHDERLKMMKITLVEQSEIQNAHVQRQ